MTPIDVPKETLKEKAYRNRRRDIKKDIRRINTVIDSDDLEKLKSVHQDLDGKYSGYIKDWGKSMYSYNTDYGFIYDSLDVESLKHNLTLMKAKLEGFMLFQDGSQMPSNMSNSIVNNVQNTVYTQLNISVAIEEAKDSIEELTALSGEQINEINNKLDELKTILESEDKKTSKWEKAKPIFNYIIDKGLDVAKIALPLVQNL